MEGNIKQQNCGIYKIENLINGKVYIGQSINVYTRWTNHKNDSKNPNSKCYNRPFYKDLRKYGIKNFDWSILECCKPEELNEREIYWVKYYDSNNLEKGYNLTPGGNEPVAICPSKLYELWDQGFTVKELTEILGVNHSTVCKWLKLHPSYSTELSRSRSGRKTYYNKEHSYEKIWQYSLSGDFIKEWDSFHEIERELGLNRASISYCCRNRYYSSYGYRWGFKDQKLLSKEEFNKLRHLFKKGNKCGSSTIQTDKEDRLRIKIYLANGLNQSDIAKILKVSRHIVSDINTGSRWNDGGKYPIYNYKEKITNRPELLKIKIS